jgi:hypothetical protein
VSLKNLESILKARFQPAGGGNSSIGHAIIGSLTNSRAALKLLVDLILTFEREPRFTATLVFLSF